MFVNVMMEFIDLKNVLVRLYAIAFGENFIITTKKNLANCAINPCINGVCTSSGCICGSGYSGYYCETLTRKFIVLGNSIHTYLCKLKQSSV